MSITSFQFKVPEFIHYSLFLKISR